MYYWSDIESVPSEPGVYAWYYALRLTDYDIGRTIDRVEERKSNGNDAEAESAVQDFLDEFVFRYFAEGSYQALLRGPLKPQYEGELEHTPTVSESLAKRIVESPERLYTLREVLGEAIPNFASPIYIGMSGNLNERLSTHKKLIAEFRAKKVVSFGLERDQNFARRVTERELIPTRLRVAVTVVSAGESQYVDAENVLNRINFPILGRN